MFKEGDWLLIRYEDKKYLRRLDSKGSLNVKKDILKFSFLLNKPEGLRVGKFEVFKATLEDIILLGFRRKTQIIYPKDAFYIAFKLGIRKNTRVLEFGTGSGALCAVLSELAGEVHTYEVVEDFFKLAKSNFERFGLGKNVVFHLEDFLKAEIKNEFYDSAFVDVKDPIPFLDKLHRVLKNSAPVGFLLPTTNQVVDLLSNIKGLFGGIEVVEIFHRYYKTVPERFRPEDTMTAHTAYLVFCRKIYN